MNTNKTGGRSPTLNNLPPRPSPFVNREEEMRQAISALLDSNVRAVALVGIAGIGKTSLALEIAYHLLAKGEFTGGIIWLSARDMQSLADLTRKVETVLRVSGSEVYSRLGSQHCLVILDGLDELNPRFVSEVERFLETLPNPSKALVTSRKEFVLPSQATVIPVSALSEQAAIELFRALGASQDKEVPYIERERVAEIIRALGYHPLALTLAARLVQGNYAETRKSSQQLLAVTDELGTERERASLLLILASLSQDQGDYSEALQLYQHSLEIAERLGDLRAKSAALHDMASIFAVQGDISRALQLYQESLALDEQFGDVRGKATTLNNMARIFLQSGDLDRAMQLYQQSLALLEQFGDSRGKSATLHNMAQIFVTRGDLDRAMQLYQESLALKEQIGDLQGKSATLHQIAGIFVTRGELDRAMQLYRESLALNEQLGDVQGKSATLHQIAGVHVARGDIDRAMQLYQESLALNEQLGDVYGKATTLNNMAQIFAIRGDLDRAMQLYQESLALKEQIGDLQGKSATLHQIAGVFATRGDLDRAMQLYQQSLAIQEQLGDLQGKSTTLNNIAQIFITRGDPDRAMQLYQQSLAIKEQVGDLAGVANVLVGIGQVLARDDPQAALEKYQRALSLYEQIGDRYSSARVLYNLGLLYRDLGDLEKALEVFAKSQSFFALLHAPEIEEAKTIRRDLSYKLGIEYVEKGRWYDALRLFQESLVLRREYDEKLSAFASEHSENPEWFRTLIRHTEDDRLKALLDVQDSRELARMAATYFQNDSLNARADTIYQIARVHHLMGNLDKARIHYRDALRLYEHTGNRQGVAVCETGLGRLMIQMGFVDDAVRELDSAMRIYHQLGDNPRIAEVEKVLQVANHIKEKQLA